MSDNKPRCPWCTGSELMIKYHDEEWGVPLHDDQKLFEFMVLDAFQAGLSWSTILNRREGFREAFANFNPQQVALFDEEKIQQLMQDTRIIRNQAKIRATVKNARAFLEIQEREGNFDTYIWQFTDHKVLDHAQSETDPFFTRSPESDAMSIQLKKDGFSFVGTTICYAFMQAAGMINDHRTSCFRYSQVKNSRA